MSLARLRSYEAPEPDVDHLILFKEDRPRRIDRVISFFGERAENEDPCGEGLLDVLGAERESTR